MRTKIGDTITVATDRGSLTGRVIGTERRDPARGFGEPQDFVCVSHGDDCQWHPAAAITDVEKDETEDTLRDLVARVGKPHVARVLGRMA